MNTHRWKICQICGPMVVCGHCGNNCCNGGSNVGCLDSCKSAYALQNTKHPPHKLLDEWETMKREGRTWHQQRTKILTLAQVAQHNRRTEK